MAIPPTSHLLQWGLAGDSEPEPREEAVTKEADTVRVGGAPLAVQIVLVLFAALSVTVVVVFRSVGHDLVLIYLAALGLVALIPVVFPRWAEVSPGGVRLGRWHRTELRWDDIAAIYCDQTSWPARLIVMPRDPHRIKVGWLGRPTASPRNYGYTVAVTTNRRSITAKPDIERVAGEVYGNPVSSVRPPENPTAAEQRRTVSPRQVVRNVPSHAVPLPLFFGLCFAALAGGIFWILFTPPDPDGLIAQLPLLVVPLVLAIVFFVHVYRVAEAQTLEFSADGITIRSLRRTTAVSWDLVRRIGVAGEVVVAVPRERKDWPRGPLWGSPRRLGSMMRLLQGRRDTSPSEIADMVTVAARAAGREDVADSVFEWSGVVGEAGQLKIVRY